ncbi:MAG TPA: hypothetical protein VMW41_02995 [Candidatus Bathyarchaeia archaeon]|nr:hypothetical protein [Candidatus Bathyarchaeia archaeon]
MAEKCVGEIKKAGLIGVIYEVRIRLEPLVKAIQEGALEPDDFQKVADFGAGYGNSARAIMIAMPGADITALEQNEELAEVIIKRGILPEERVKRGDGIDFLSESRNARKFTLVTAFGLEPIKDSSLFKKFVIAADNALRDKGKLLIESDAKSMGVVRSELRKASVNAYSRDVGLGGMVVLTRDECDKVASYYNSI